MILEKLTTLFMFILIIAISLGCGYYAGYTRGSANEKLNNIRINASDRNYSIVDFYYNLENSDTSKLINISIKDRIKTWIQKHVRKQ